MIWFNLIEKYLKIIYGGNLSIGKINNILIIINILFKLIILPSYSS